jgi:hypothetical protein
VVNVPEFEGRFSKFKLTGQGVSRRTISPDFLDNSNDSSRGGVSRPEFLKREGPREARNKVGGV